MILIAILVTVKILVLISTDNYTDFPLSAQADSSPPDSGPVNVSSDNKDYTDILKKNNIFDHSYGPGGSDGDLYPEYLNNENASSPAWSELEIELQGTIAGPTTIARAIIKDLATDTTNTYKINDPVKFARLAEINKTSVCLTMNGYRHILRLNSKGQDTSKNQVPAPSSPTRNNQNSSPENIAPVDNAVKLFDTILSRAEVITANSEQEPEGLRLANLEELGISPLTGLKNGDIIQVVNGQKLTSRQKAYQVFQKAKTQPRLEIEVLRNNNIITITLSQNVIADNYSE